MEKTSNLDLVYHECLRQHGQTGEIDIAVLKAQTGLSSRIFAGMTQRLLTRKPEPLVIFPDPSKRGFYRVDETSTNNLVRVFQDMASSHKKDENTKRKRKANALLQKLLALLEEIREEEPTWGFEEYRDLAPQEEEEAEELLQQPLTTTSTSQMVSPIQFKTLPYHVIQ